MRPNGPLLAKLFVDSDWFDVLHHLAHDDVVRNGVEIRDSESRTAGTKKQYGDGGRDLLRMVFQCVADAKQQSFASGGHAVLFGILFQGGLRVRGCKKHRH